MVIFISGSINAGKTTAGKLLARRLGYEFIDFDKIHDTIPGFLLNKDLPKVFDEGIRRLNKLDAAGKNVVVSYVIRQEDYERLERELTAEAKYVTLAPLMAVVQSDRGRGLNDWERERIDYHYRTGIADPTFGLVLDNSKMNPEETVGKIMQALELKSHD
jgi:shikimate kinase